MKYIGKSLISVDWLSIYVSCLGKKTPQVGAVRAMDYGTQVYQFTEYYQLNGVDVACLTWQPRSAALKGDTGIIKILNEYLYIDNLYEFTMGILEDWGLLPLSVSRLDICADFNRFWDYSDMNEFFHDFLNCKIWKIGKAKYKVIGKERRKLQDDSFSMHGLQAAKHSFQYLRFGGNTSDVAAYLYNKTLEFKEVKQKNYILQMWEANNMDTDCDVWRLEFSIKGNALKIIDETTGDQTLDKLLIIKEEKLLHRLFAGLFKKYWDFRVNDGQVRKDRMKHCNLLKLNDMPLKIKRIYQAPQTTIGDKRLVASMERVYNELRQAGREDYAIVHWAIDRVVDYKRLRGWHDIKFGSLAAMQ